MNKLFLLFIFLNFNQVGCSVAGVGHSALRTGLPTEVTPSPTSAESPAPQKPVIVSEPVNAIPATRLDEIEPTQPEQMEPVVESELELDFFIEETPTNPTMIFVEGTPITNIEIEPNTAPPSVPPENSEMPDVADTNQVPVSTPQLMIDAVEAIEIQAPVELAELNPNEEQRRLASDYEENDPDLAQEPESPEVTVDSEEEVDFVVEGKCHGKKKATVLYNQKGKPKKGLTVSCKNDHFKIRTREKKKHLKFLKVQTLLQ